MKKKIIYLILAVLTLGLLATSCEKADLLEGTAWVCHPYEDSPEVTWTISFVNKVECTIIGGGYLHGEYSGEKDKITIDFGGAGKLIGTIKGEEMKLHWDDTEEVYTFKKKK